MKHNKKKIQNHGRIDDKDRAFRGGCWYYLSFDCRAASRVGCAPGYRNVSLGLRLVVPAPRISENNDNTE